MVTVPVRPGQNAILMALRLKVSEPFVFIYSTNNYEIVNTVDYCYRARRRPRRLVLVLERPEFELDLQFAKLAAGTDVEPADRDHFRLDHLPRERIARDGRIKRHARALPRRFKRHDALPLVRGRKWQEQLHERPVRRKLAAVHRPSRHHALG